MIKLIKEQDDIEIYLYAKELGEPKHEVLIQKLEDAGTKHFSDPNAFIKCSNRMNDVFENTDDYNPNRQKNFDCVWWHDCRHYE